MAFVIPSVFTAVDRMGAMDRIGRRFTDLADTAQTAAARMERSMRRIHDRASNIAGSTAAAGAAILAPIALIGKQASDFEPAVASFRTIVSDLNDTQFERFRKEIFSVGNTTRKSYTDVATTFEKIAGLNADFAKTAYGLGQVSTAAIILSKASREDLGTSAENLVGIMNQFGFAADQANRSINVLAAGQAVGAATISETAESLKIFGAVAASSNTTIEQSVALIETLAAKSLKGEQAGTALRGSFTRLQKAGLGYKTGQFQIIDALEEARKKVDALRSAKAKDAYVTDLFGLENLTAGKILIANIDKFKEFTRQVTGTAEAQKAAAINSAPFAERLKQARERVGNLAIKIGDKLLPILNKLLDRISPFIDRIGDWIDKNPELTQTIVAAAAALGGMLVGVSALSTAIAAITSPIGLVVAGIAALILVAGMAYKKSEAFRDAINGLWDSIKPLLVSLWDMIQAVGAVLMPIFIKIAKITVEIVTPVFRILTKVFQGVGFVFQKLADFADRHPWLKTIANGIMNLVTGPLKLFKWALEGIADLLDAIFPKSAAEIAVNAAVPSAAAMFAGMKTGLPVGVMTPVGMPKEETAPLFSGGGSLNNADMEQLAKILNSAQQVNVTVSAAPGTNAAVTKNTGGIIPKTTSTTAQR